MDSPSLKKDHKFFIRDINNDLDSLMDWVLAFDLKLRSNEIANIPESLIEDLKTPSGFGTRALGYYNIFSYNNEALNNLKNELNTLLKEACKYYEIDYDSYKWGLHGWFNRNAKEDMWDVSPIDHPQKFHEHLSGIGAPDFHGYYSVNAEPSVTVYKIGKDSNNIKINVNKNNRVILSEVGHPHGMGNWRSDDLRITIAYDITPITDDAGGYWTCLN